MHFQDVDLPQVVIDARKRGNLVLFAGAGVSMDAPSNYPNFRDLATDLGGTAYPIEDHELIDRYLGRLVENGIPVHDRVKGRLAVGFVEAKNVLEASDDTFLPCCVPAS